MKSQAAGAASSTCCLAILLCLLGLHLVQQLSALTTTAPGLSCPDRSFGVACNLSCSEHCNAEDKCTSTQTGGCTEGCQKGWQNFPTCNETCPPGRFYFNCSRYCHCNDTGEVCERKNGNCDVSGCHADWIGPGCQTRLPVLTTPPRVAAANCSHLLVTFRSFNASVDTGVDSVGYYAVEAAGSGGSGTDWTPRANVSAGGPSFQVWLAGFDPLLAYRFRVRILYREGFFERLGSPSNESDPGRLNCVDSTTAATEASQTSTQSTTMSITSTIVTETPTGTTVAESTTLSSSTAVPSTIITSSDTTTTDRGTTIAGATTSTVAPGEGTGDSTALIVTLAVLLFLAVCAALALLLYWCRARRDAGGKKPFGHVAMATIVGPVEPRSAPFWTSIRDLAEFRRPVYSPAASASSSTTGSAPTTTMVITFQAEFDSLPRGTLASRLCEVARRSENLAKNETPMCLPYDHNRVVFKGDPNLYYNASIVKGYVRRDAYIAAQSPRDSDSAGLLWRAVVEQNVAQVVAASGEQDPSAYKYWPEEPGQEATFGGVRVRCVAKRRRGQFIYRRLRVNGLAVTQHQLLGRPNDPLALVAMYTSIRAAARIEDGPILVHCRTGIGPSCVLIGLDWLLQQAAHEDGALSAYKCVRSLRRCRTNAVADARQYALLYDAAFEALLRRGYSIVPGGGVDAVDAFLAAFDAPRLTDGGGRGTSALEEQFDLLIRFGPILDGPSAATAAVVDESRWKSTTPLSFNSLQEADAVLGVEVATAGGSLNAFWLDVHRRRISVVICLGGASDAATIFPPGSTDMAVSEGLPILELADVRLLQTVSTAVANKRRQTLNLSLSQLHGRQRPGEPTTVELVTLDVNLDDLSADILADAVVTLTTGAASGVGVGYPGSAESPWLLVGSHGRSIASRCGLLAAALQAGQQLAEDGYADVCWAVRGLHRRHPAAVANAGQYRLLYRCLSRLEGSRPRRRRRRHQGKSADTGSVLASTLDSDYGGADSSIYDYCQLPVRPHPVEVVRTGRAVGSDTGDGASLGATLDDLNNAAGGYATIA